MSLDSKRSVLTLTTATVIKEDLFVLEMCTLFVLTLIDLAMQCYWSFLCFLAAASAAARAAATEAGKSAAETVKPKTFSGMNIEEAKQILNVKDIRRHNSFGSQAE